MAPVTIKSTSRNAYTGSTLNVGFSSGALFGYSTIYDVRVGGSVGNLGDTTSSAKVAQRIVPTRDCHLRNVLLSGTKFGSPTDNVVVELWSDSSGTPNAVIQAADNVLAGTSYATSASWHDFRFDGSSAPALTNGVSYWIVVSRSGAADASNYYRYLIDTGNPYSSGGRRVYNGGTSTWGAESSTIDVDLQIFAVEPSALYTVTQDSALHVFKSTDNGASWSEQDSSNAPTCNAATAAFTACDSEEGPWLLTGRFTAANTVNIRQFMMNTDTWASADFGTTPPSTVSPDRGIHLSSDNLHTTSNGAQNGVTLIYADSVDDADLAYQRASTSGGAWGVKTVFLAATSSSSSSVAGIATDRNPTAFRQMFYYDVGNSDFSFRSLQSTTLGTEVDIDATAATSMLDYATGIYQPYIVSGVDTVIAAYIDSASQIHERILSMGVTSASVTMATENTVSTNTTSSGRQLSTARYGSTNYIAADASGTNIIYFDSTTAGTWNGPTTAVSTGTAVYLACIKNLGVGLAVLYTENNVAKFDWIVAPSTTSTRTATPVTISAGVVSTRTATPVTIALQDTETRTASATIALSGTLTRTANATIAVQQLNTTRTATPVTVALSLAKTRTATPVTVALQATSTRTASATIALIQTRTRTASATIALSTPNLTRTATPVTVSLTLQGTRTATPVTVALSLTKTRTATPVTVSLNISPTRTASATIALIATKTRTATPVTAALSLVSTRTASATIALSQARSRTASATIAIQTYDVRIATSNTIALSGVLTRSASATIALSSTGGGTRTATPVTFALSTPNLTRTASATVSAGIVGTRTATTTIAIQSWRSLISTPTTLSLSEARTRTANATIAVQKLNTTRTASATISVSLGNVRTATPVTIALSLTQTRSASATIALQKLNLTRTATTTIALSLAKTRTATPVTVALLETRARTASATVTLQKLNTSRSASATIALQKLNTTRTASATMALSLAKTRTATPVTMALRAVMTRTAPATLTLWGSTTLTVPATISAFPDGSFHAGEPIDGVRGRVTGSTPITGVTHEATGGIRGSVQHSSGITGVTHDDTHGIRSVVSGRRRIHGVTDGE